MRLPAEFNVQHLLADVTILLLVDEFQLVLDQALSYNLSPNEASKLVKGLQYCAADIACIQRPLILSDAEQSSVVFIPVFAGGLLYPLIICLVRLSM